MNIAHIVCTYPPYYGGMGNAVFQMARFLAERGHDVEVFTPDYFGSNDIRPKDAPEAVVHAPAVAETLAKVRLLTPEFRFGNAARLGTLRAELDRFDIVHLHYPFFGTANLVRRWKKQHPDRPLVLTYHMDAWSPGWKGLFFGLYSRFWMPRILSSADVLITSSFDYLAASDAARLWRTHPEPWVELPFGVDTMRFRRGEKPFRLFDAHQLALDVPTVLFVGGMDAPHAFKGIPVLLVALKILQEREKSVQGVFVGDGEYRASFEQQAKGLGLSGLVRFVGRISEEALPEYYRMGDLFVLPSTSAAEAFGIVLLEAYASGVPVLASDLPGVRHVARAAGAVSPPNNAAALAGKIAEYFDQSVEARKDAQTRARAVAETQYSWGPIAEKLEHLYRDIVDKMRKK